jgi:hypothetical protein
MNKLVREHIESFVKSENPFDSFNIGKIDLIKKWLDPLVKSEEDYKINEDGTIDLYEDFNIVGLGLEELPEYIKFGIAHKGFYAADNNFKNLNGFPKKIKGDFSIHSNSSSSIIPRFWTEDYIRKKIKVYGTIYNF